MAERRKRRRRAVAAITGSVALLGLIIAVVLVVTATSTPNRANRGHAGVVDTAPFAPATTTGLSTSPPPWPLPTHARLDIANAGLTAASSETTTVHYHAHLDINVDGSPVTVPAGAGFVIQGGQEIGVTALHTHDSSGVIHIESPSAKAYTLGQFFTEWGVAIGSGHLGGVSSGNGEVWRVFVDGRPFRGNPATIVLKPHQEVTLWYGPSTATPQVPSSYAFPQGE